MIFNLSSLFLRIASGVDGKVSSIFNIANTSSIDKWPSTSEVIIVL